MEIFKSGVDLLQLGVTAMGGGAVLMGLLNIFESLSSDNPETLSKADAIPRTKLLSAMKSNCPMKRHARKRRSASSRNRSSAFPTVLNFLFLKSFIPSK